MKILLVEDDESLAQLLAQALTNQHHTVELAFDGQAGWELVEVFTYDLIVLDIMLPKLDGISFCRRLRQISDRTPILLLTAHDTSTNRVMGLDAGADDYLVKPFDLQELFARIRALLRRGSSTLTPAIEWGALCLNPTNCEITYNGQLLPLTSKEYALLELFLRNTQRIFSKSALLDRIWSYEEPPSDSAVRTHIKSLRKKLTKAGAASDLIETVYGLGYRLKAEGSSIQNSKPQRGVLHKPEEVPASSTFKIQNSHIQETKCEPAPQNPKSKIEAPPAIIPEMAAIWERHKQKYLDRIAILERAVIALREGNLSESLRQQALREAHTLAGSLGSFGFDEASYKSRTIEQILQADAKLDCPEELSRQVEALQQAIEQPSFAWDANNQFPATEKNNLTSKRLLIVDDDATLALALANKAKAWGMQAEVALDLSDARVAIDRAQPDVVLLDLSFPDSVETGYDLLAELTAARAPVPVLVFTAKEDFAERVKVARLGGRGFLQKPASLDRVMDAIAKVLQKSSTPIAKLLVVDDDSSHLDLIRTLLEPWGFQLTLLDDPQQFWNTLEQSAPDLLILDVEMPGYSGIDLCSTVRNDPHWSNLPILFLSACTDTQIVHQAFAIGVDDYINKPVVASELVARVLNRLERFSQAVHS